MAEGGGGGGGGGNAEFLAALPEDIRADPTLASVPDVATLAKNYVNAQKLIGTRRLPEPQAGWTEKEWNDLYGKLGRPETPDKYSMPELKLEEGLSFDTDRMKAAREFFHKSGLTDRQAKGILEYYGNVLNDQVKGMRTRQEQSVAQTMADLKAEWGDKTDANIDLAKSVIKKFGDEPLLKHLETAELGNNPSFIKALAKIGQMMQEDSSRGSGRATLDVKDSTAAMREIEALKMDVDFQTALQSSNHMGHMAAVQKWNDLFKVAYPGKQAE